MKLNKEEIETLYNTINSYIITNKTSVYKLDKEGILSRKTLYKILKKDYTSIEENTLKKILNFPKLNKENKEKIKKIIGKGKKISNSCSSQEIAITSFNKELEKMLQEIKILIKENSIYNLRVLEPSSLKENNEYLQKRKIGSFNSDLENRTLLIKKMWDFNDTVSEKWKEFNLLLGINNKKDSIKMKKGLLTIAENLKEIVVKLENAAFDSSEINKEEIIIIEEDKK